MMVLKTCFFKKNWGIFTTTQRVKHCGKLTNKPINRVKTPIDYSISTL